MSTPRTILAIVVVFVLSCVFGTLIHAILLHDDYASVASVYRAAKDASIPLIFTGYLSFAIGSVWMYAHGVEDKAWLGQGVRFGVAVWLVLAVPSFLIAYATQPDNVALDGEGRNSPFTAALLKHLVTPGLEIGTLMKRVRADVIAATREKQVPWDHSSLIGDVVLAK